MLKTAIRLFAGLAILFAIADGASAQLVDKKGLTLAEARKIAAAAEAEAGKLNIPFCISIMDDGGHLIYFQRMDEAQWGSVAVSQAKALAAISYKRPTKSFQDRVASGGAGLTVLGLPGAVPSEGGVPLMANGKVIGSIGVSGGDSSQDGQVANAGAAVLK